MNIKTQKTITCNQESDYGKWTCLNCESIIDNLDLAVEYYKLTKHHVFPLRMWGEEDEY